jgi:hypothetical protein
MPDTITRTKQGVLEGKSSLEYRYVFEFDPPVHSRKKQPDGTNDLSRLEFFGSGDDVFFMLHIALSRMLEDPQQMKRAEAVKLDGKSHAAWTDKNKDEAE